MREQKQRTPKITKAVLAKATGKLERLNQELKYILEELVEIKRYIHETEDRSKEKGYTIESEIFKNLKLNQEKKSR